MRSLFDVLNQLPTHTSNHQACVLPLLLPHDYCQSSPTDECWRCYSDNHIISCLLNSLVAFSSVRRVVSFNRLDGVSDVTSCRNTHRSAAALVTVSRFDKLSSNYCLVGEFVVGITSVDLN